MGFHKQKMSCRITTILLLWLVPSLLHLGNPITGAAHQKENSKLANNTSASKEALAELQDNTPEAAIRSFYTALANGDATTASQLLESSDKMAKWVEVQIDQTNAFRQLGMAAISRFGEDGKVLQVPVPAESALKKLESIKPIQNGDTAEWRTNPNVPSKLVRKNGHWKLDLYSSFQKPEHLAQQVDVFGRIAKYVKEIAADIETGRLASIPEVREEFKKQRAKLNAEAAK